MPPSAVRQHPLRSSYMNFVGESEGASVGDAAAEECAKVDGNAVGAVGMVVGDDVGLAVGDVEGAALGAAVGVHVHALQ